MRKLFLFALLCVSLPAVRAAQTTPASPLIFPSISSYSLDKAKIDLPHDLEGKINLLLISFTPDQAKQLNTWVPAAQSIQHMNFDFRFYQLPVSPQENMLYRWWNTSSMRSVETDPETWHWIVPLFLNKEDFRHALDISDEREIVAMLVDKTGRITWRASGNLSDEKKTSLAAAVAAATQH